METLVVVSKTKKFIKETAGLNTSSAFFEGVSSIVDKTLDAAIENAHKAKRKTIMGRDFADFEKAGELKGEILVVASKVKKLVKDKSGLNTSAQVLPALTLRVQQACLSACDQAKSHGRKTVMDRDIAQ